MRGVGTWGQSWSNIARDVHPEMRFGMTTKVGSDRRKIRRRRRRPAIPGNSAVDDGRVVRDYMESVPYP